MTEAQGTELLSRIGILLDHVLYVETWMQQALAVLLVITALNAIIGVAALWRTIKG